MEFVLLFDILHIYCNYKGLNIHIGKNYARKNVAFSNGPFPYINTRPLTPAQEPGYWSPCSMKCAGKMRTMGWNVFAGVVDSALPQSLKRSEQSRPDERTLRDILQNTGLQPCVLDGGRVIQ